MDSGLLGKREDGFMSAGLIKGLNQICWVDERMDSGLLGRREDGFRYAG